MDGALNYHGQKGRSRERNWRKENLPKNKSNEVENMDRRRVSRGFLFIYGIGEHAFPALFGLRTGDELWCERQSAKHFLNKQSYFYHGMDPIGT